MTKRMTRLLSLILTLVMFLSVVTPAYAVGGDGEPDEGWDREIGEDEIHDLDIDGDLEFEEEYDYFQALDEENGVQVTIEAPMGSLPTLAEVRLEPIPAEDLQDAVNEIVDGSPEILVAMDISFWLGEDEIEPEEPVRVKISAPELEGKTNLQVIHFPDDAEEPETVQLIPEEDLTFALGTNEVAFQADSFSVYVVVDDGSEDDNARLEVNFFNLEHDDENPISTVYIKNSDFYLGSGEREQGKSYIDDIVYDPGIGEGYSLGSNMFRGWTIDAADANPQPQPTEEEPNPDPVPYGANYNRNTKVYTVDDITKYLAGRLGSIQEGQVLNIYAMIFQTYTISYYGASTDVSMGMHTVFAPLNANAEAPYKIDMTYTPEDNEHFFEGWMILDGAENIVSATAPDGTVIEGRVPISAADPDADPPVKATVFPNSSTLIVKGNVSFAVSQPAGRWLIFKENGKGATYNAPEFVKSGEVTYQPTTALPTNMVRNGYDFVDWYEVQVTYNTQTGRAEPVTDANGGYVFASTEPFEFGKVLTKETIIAAKWTARSDAQYTIVLWKQNLDGDGYDFWRAIPLAGTTGATIAGITQNGANVVDVDESGASRTTKNVKISGTNLDGTAFNEEISELGFHTGHYDTQDTEIKIAAEGNTVINIYYDRNIVQLNFWIYYSSAPILAWPGPGDPDLDDGGTYYCDDPEDGEDSNTVYQVYKNDDGDYVYDYTRTEEVASVNDLQHSSGVNDSYNNTTYYAVANNTTYRIWYSSSYGQWVAGTSSSPSYYASAFFNSDITVYHYLGSETRPAHSPYYYRAGTGWQRAAVIQGLYQSSLSANGYAWPTTVNGNAYRWRESYSGSSATGTTTVLLDAFDTQNESMVTNFYGESFSAACTIHFLTQNIDGTYTESGTAESTTGTFYLTDKFTGYHLTHYKIGSNGTTVNVSENQKKLDTENGQWYYDANPSTTAIDGVSYDTDLYVYFDRLSYKISYQDGTYADGNDNTITDENSLGFIGESEEIIFGNDISAYGDKNDTTHYFVPEHDGYVFEGWYADETCKVPYEFDTMPLGGVTVYAKWRKIQFRVFLRTNVPTSDGSLDWGSDDQGMNFRITEGDYVSAPHGTRAGYVFVGWYYDDDFDDAFNSEVVPLTRSNVTDDYDKTATLYMTDNEQTWTNPKTGKVENKPINKYGVLEPGDPGINKDVNRFWITKKLDLYAKWKAILDGAEGISVLYDEVPGEGAGHGQAGTAPGDGGRLYEDNAKAIAQAASKAAAENEKFLYWVVQKWVAADAENNVEGHWEDVLVEGETIKVYPGDNFLVKAEYARITPDPDDLTGEKNFYEVQLRAVYGSKDAPAPTHITWYSNIYDIAGNQFVDTETNSKMTHPSDATWNEDSGWYITQDPVEINNAYAIPTPPYSYEGYTFLGWGRVCDPDSIPEGSKAYVTDPSTLTEEDLYIKWVPATDDAAAHYEAQLPKDKLTRDYYIVGFLNGVDDDNGIKIPKSSGKISITFTAETYVTIKAGNSDDERYCCASYQTGNSAQMWKKSHGNSEKLFIPVGTELTFTLTEEVFENGDVNSVTLSYTTGDAPSGDIAPMNLRGGEEELEWKTVQYVAADEEKPYHDMYAIWGGEFKVYHSGVEGGAVETYQITRANKELDLTRYYVASRADTDPHAGEYKDSGFLYGGYYLDGGFTAPAVDDKGVPTAECAAYDGANWTWTKPVTDQPGNAITPKGGVTYYIKEVPASKYLQPYFHYTYLKESDPAYQTIRTAWLISDIDDAMYKETGFVIISDNDKANVCTTLTVQTTVGGSSVLLRPENIFRKQGVTKGFLSYLEVISDGQQTLLKEGNTVVQYWVTPDGLIVTGTSARTFNALDTRANIKAEGGVTTETVHSTIGVFSAPAAEPEP